MGSTGSSIIRYHGVNVSIYAYMVGSMKHTTQYLYDCHPLIFAFLPYIVALYLKRHMAFKHMRKLRRMADKVINDPIAYEPIRDHYLDVKKAKDFNQKLIDEILNRVN